jgi:hypothetical protein
MRIFVKLTLWTILIGAFGIVPFAVGWDCDVTLSGPSTIKKEQTITLEASGDPSGGTYAWWRIPNLIPNGNSAGLTAFEPSFSDYIRVGVNYTTPRGKKCSKAKYIWYEKCCAKISGPNTVALDETITLSASGEPIGGSFIWENSNPEAVQLETTGNSATLLGLAPGTTTITLVYDYSESEPNCHAYLEVNVISKCSINLHGAYIMTVGHYGFMNAFTSPEGGSLTWTAHPNIESINDDYIYHGTEIPGVYTYEAKYTLTDGSSCSNTFDVVFGKVDSVSGPFCVNSGMTLSKSDFTVTTIPEGYNFPVTISPLTYTTDLPYFDETVTASLSSGLTDDATQHLQLSIAVISLIPTLTSKCPII